MPTCPDPTCRNPTWTGSRPCHCSACHETFSGVELFDRHRDRRGEHGHCRDPKTVAGAERWTDGIWHMPGMSDEGRARVTRARNRGGGLT